MTNFLIRFMDEHERLTHRFLEILPGSFSWTMILFPIWGSFWVPHYVGYLVILLDIYWFYKSGTLALATFFSYRHIKKTKKIDWLEKARRHPNWDKIHHLIIMPTYLEPIETLEKSIQSLVDQDVGKEKMTLVCAFEKREKDAPKKAKILKEKFEKFFANFWVTYHPDIAGEVKGKSSNQRWAVIWAKKELIEKMGYDIDWVTVTSKDADTIFHYKYYSLLSFEFLENPMRHFRFWQPAILFYNNIWRVPAPIRVVNTFNNIFQTGLLARKDRLINLSTYSLSLKMLDEVGYWDGDVIAEDYRIFFKSYFALDGNVEVESLSLPVYADAAESTSWWKTMVNQYQQYKRWAWGVADDPFVIKNWVRAKRIPFWNKTTRLINVLEDHFLWPVNWFIITLGANVPILLNPRFSETVMGQNLPKVAFFVLTLSFFFFPSMLLIEFAQRPKPKGRVFLRRVFSLFEFILMPVVGFFFNALPALDAHTRLMLGKYIEYRVTEKVSS